MEDLKQLVEDFIEYTKNFSITEEEWYYNMNSCRKSNYIDNKNITQKEFEQAIREEILYSFIYNINSIKTQLENDLCNYYEEDNYFQNANKEIEKKIQKIFKDFKIER